MIKIQEKNFSIEKEVNNLKSKHKDIGALNVFIGYVRNMNLKKEVNSIYLEVYPLMAKKKLKEIIAKAKKRWKIKDYLIIHRYGKLKVAEKIVMVAIISKHRNESFLSCKYIMDNLKKEAPFWKKENYKKSSKWLIN